MRSVELFAREVMPAFGAGLVTLRQGARRQSRRDRAAHRAHAARAGDPVGRRLLGGRCRRAARPAGRRGGAHRPGPGRQQLSRRRRHPRGGARDRRATRSIRATASSPSTPASRARARARACVFIGPPPEAIESMGVKTTRAAPDGGGRRAGRAGHDARRSARAEDALATARRDRLSRWPSRPPAAVAARASTSRARSRTGAAAFERAASRGRAVLRERRRLRRASTSRIRATSRCRSSPTRTATSCISASATARSSGATRSSSRSRPGRPSRPSCASASARSPSRPRARSATAAPARSRGCSSASASSSSR